MPGPDAADDDDLALLVGAARIAGEIALRYWRKSPRVWEKADDEGPVTEADLAVNAALAAHLCGARPSYAWLSEESADSRDRLNYEHVFIIDPIDGTRAFIDGQTGFSHALAVARGGQVSAAVVYLPATDQLYAARQGGPATLNGQPILASAQAGVAGATILTPAANMAAEHWIGPPPDLRRAFRPSVAHRLALVAEGRFDGILSFRSGWEWDIAAGALIAARAGATVSDRNGKPLVFNNEKPRLNGLLAAAPGLHSELVARLVPHP